MFRTVMLISCVLLMGCAGTGFDKKATLMPDTVGLYYESAQIGDPHSWDSLKIGIRSDWKFAAPTLKEKTINVSTNSVGNSQTK